MMGGVAKITPTYPYFFLLPFLFSLFFIFQKSYSAFLELYTMVSKIRGLTKNRADLPSSISSVGQLIRPTLLILFYI